LLITHFRAPHKQKKIQKNQRNVGRDKKIYINEKSKLDHLENYQRLVEKDQIYKIKKIW